MNRIILSPKNKLKYSFLLLAVFLSNCNFNANVTYENEESEKQKAESVTTMFYQMLSRDEFKETLKLFSDSFYKVSSKGELEKYLLDKEENLGQFKDFNLKEWKTHRVTGTNSITQYVLTYEVNYTKAKVIERITLVKEEDEVRICGYSVDEPIDLH